MFSTVLVTPAEALAGQETSWLLMELMWVGASSRSVFYGGIFVTVAMLLACLATNIYQVVYQKGVLNRSWRQKKRAIPVEECVVNLEGPRDIMDIETPRDGAEVNAYECLQYEQYDKIVIGGGVGGMTTAALLSRAGYKVLVLEKNATFGGCSGNTKAGSGLNFDIGLDSIGQTFCGPRYGLTTLPGEKTAQFRLCGTEQDGYTGDKFCFPDGQVLEMAKDRLFDDLRKKYPHETEALNKYEALVQHQRYIVEYTILAKRLPNCLRQCAQAFLSWYYPNVFIAADKAFENMFTDKRLIGDLLAHAPYYCETPSKGSLLGAMLVHEHYMPGAYYPVGGGSTITKSMVPTIAASGGRVVTSAGVKEILLNKAGNTVRGVSVYVPGTNGETLEVEADEVLSGIGFLNTYSRLLPKHIGKKHGFDYDQFLEANKGHSVQYCAVYMSFDKPAEELGLDSVCYWFYDGLDKHNYDMGKYFDSIDGKKFDDFVEEPGFHYFKSPAGKDPDYAKNNNGCSNVKMVLVTKRDWWAGKTADERADMNDRLAKAYAEKVYQKFPKCRAATTDITVWSPENTEKWIGSQHGCSLGANLAPAAFVSDWSRFLQPRQPIKGLYLTGQDAYSCGVAGAMAGGWNCVQTVLGYDGWLATFTRSLKNDLLAQDKAMNKGVARDFSKLEVRPQ